MRFTPRLLLSSILFSERARSAAFATIMNADEPNPPTWPDSVKIIRESDDMESVLAALKETEDGWNEEYHSWNSDHHFSDRRHALLFAPGTYNLTFEVGYYVQVAGLGLSPDDVEFRNCGPHVPALNHDVHEGGTCLDTFWRSVENIRVSETNMTWAVSQAAPLRRIHVDKDLFLFDGPAYASGGHLANAQVDGVLRFGTQQQWMSRNVHLGKGIQGGAWSLVFAGCTGQVPQYSPGSDSSPSITVLESLPVRIEKPYVALQEDGVNFDLRVPKVIRDGATDGPLFGGFHDDVRDFSRVHVAIADSNDTSYAVQVALDAGKDIVFAPGIHRLTKTLEIRHANQVVLGLGLATVMAPADGSPCIRVAPNTPGVRIGGIMLEASTRSECTADGPRTFSSLLEWGEEKVKDDGDFANPGAMFDVFCRVGGAAAGNRADIHVDAMIRIHSGNVVGDNLWLWRADHGELNDSETPNYPHISPLYHQSEENEFRAETGIEVCGDDVTLFGFAVEHANGHQTVWSGERGAVYFYQCELPYDVKQSSFGDCDFTGYLVTDNVRSHILAGAGVYSNFRNEPVRVATAFKHPGTNIQCINPFTVRLDNHGQIESIVNGEGDLASEQGKPVRLA